MSTNILDKSDRSHVFLPSNGQPITKRNVYAWTTRNVEGVFRNIGKQLLNIDGTYQRDQVSETKVRQIARDWDWLLLGTISVIERQDGSLWVFDGGHRVRASFYRDDVAMLPCMVHKVDDMQSEAKGFVARNTMVSNVSAYHRYKASLVAGEPVSIKTQSMLSDFQLEVCSFGTQKSGRVTCIALIQSMISQDEEGARKAIELCSSIALDEHLSSSVLHGLFAIYIRFKSEFDVFEKYGEKIRRYSQKEIQIEIRRFTAECGGKGGAVMCGKAILRIINKNLRTKLEW